MRTPILPPIHRDDVTETEVEQGDLAFRRRRLGAAAGCRTVGLSLYAVPPGRRQMPFHQHADEEEIFYILGGSGLAVMGSSACPIGPGDAIVHRTASDGGAPHTLMAGDDGLEVLAFADGSDTNLTWLPRAQAMFAASRWLPIGGPHPFAAEAAAGPLQAPPAGERGPNVVNVRDLDGPRWRRLGTTAGALRSDLNHVTVAPGTAATRLHCHSTEEELFCVLEGDGHIEIGDAVHPLRAGSVVARPPGTGVAHRIHAGDGGLTYLAYATHDDGDAILYPESRTVRLSGLGVTLDLPPAGD